MRREIRRKHRPALLGAVVTTFLVAALWVLPVLAARPRFASVVVTDNKSPGSQNSLLAGDRKDLRDFHAGGCAIVCTWIAEGTQVAPPNYVIDKAELKVGGIITRGTCWLSKPTNGWPEGRYRFEMTLGGRLAHVARFRISG